MNAKLLATLTAVAITSAFTPTSAFSRGSEAAQAREECENRCGLYSPQTAACYKKCEMGERDGPGASFDLTRGLRSHGRANSLGRAKAAFRAEYEARKGTKKSGTG
jgi:hypothetical protein